MTRFALASAGLLAVGCGGPAVTVNLDVAHVGIVAGAPSYAAGETVRLNVRNDSLADAFYAETMRLERSEGGQWTDAYPEMENLFSYPILGANKAIIREMELGQDLPSGTYRISELTSWVNAKEAYPVYSVPFSVTAQ